MIHLSTDLAARYASFLTQKGTGKSTRLFYVKWLRYYFDFCTKYSFEVSKPDSLSAFLIKLHTEKQPQFTQDQAKKAIALFWELEKSQGTAMQDEKLHVPDNNQVSRKVRPPVSTPASPNHSLTPAKQTQAAGDEAPQLKQTGADWHHVYTELENAIRIKNYSPKTLKSYVGYTRQFQTFLESKDPQLVTAEEVKGFLTWLTVTKCVSASSRNLAFNT